MANPRPLKLTNAALLQTLKEQNRLEFQKKSKFWASKWRFFKNVALEPIWVGHGCFRMFQKCFQPIHNKIKNNFPKTRKKLLICSNFGAYLVSKPR